MTEMLECDYVVVGGGSAGCVLGNRLSENPANRVVLLEAGPAENWMVRMPAAIAALVPLRTQRNWAFRTVPQPELGGRKGYQPRGRGLGGSSTINAMIYARGTPGDYDGWAQENAGWSYADVLPHFRNSECFTAGPTGGNTLHGGAGPLPVSAQRFPHPASHAFVAACVEAGLPANLDFSGPSLEGAGLYHVTQKDGQRASVARAYLEPVRQRANLRVITGAMAERILFDQRRATGVVFSQGPARREVRARREVILSAGAFQSPQLLMLSGIGPAAHLRQLGLQVLRDLPGVGENLQDHLDFLQLHRSPDASLFGFTLYQTLAAPAHLWNYAVRRSGRLTTNVAEAGAFFRTDPALAEPDIQLHFCIAAVGDHGRERHWGVSGIGLHTCVLTPKSRGTVRLRTANPMDGPLIDPRYLSHPDDLPRMLSGAREAQRILRQPAFARYLGRALHGSEAPDDTELSELIRARADTIYHPVGTCRMGLGPADVVDARLRVHGIANLRVVDASIMPEIVRGNTNAPSVMIAEKAAAMIAVDQKQAG